MQIAVASQNRRAVTDHLGRCRRFWLFDVREGRWDKPQLVELSKEQTLHAVAPDIPMPLHGVDVLLSAGMGLGIHDRLKKRGIEARVSTCDDPEDAVRTFLAAG